MKYLLCSDCFQDFGLRVKAQEFGVERKKPCLNCGSRLGMHLHRNALLALTQSFFVDGTITKFRFGQAPAIVFNHHQETSIEVAAWLSEDVLLLSRLLKVGFFHYGPRYWMMGEITPLQRLLKPRHRGAVIADIFSSYPTVRLSAGTDFFRIRKAPSLPEDPNQYDSPPKGKLGAGRFDSSRFPVLYGSTDLELCVHECRVTVEDEVFVATLAPKRALKLLDLTELLQEDTWEFESLDHAVHLLFLAGSHSYEITRAIGRAAKKHGYHGIIYPSYFSLLRTGLLPLQTTYGISHRRIPSLATSEKIKIVPNLALFGRPIAEDLVRVKCINRLILRRAHYSFDFGPLLVTK